MIRTWEQGYQTCRSMTIDRTTAKQCKCTGLRSCRSISPATIAPRCFVPTFLSSLGSLHGSLVLFQVSHGHGQGPFSSLNMSMSRAHVLQNRSTPRADPAAAGLVPPTMHRVGQVGHTHPAQVDINANIRHIFYPVLAGKGDESRHQLPHRSQQTPSSPSSPLLIGCHRRSSKKFGRLRRHI